ncbi:hypothetical protein P7H22_20655 [Paenibacillus larvae]|nr:hypothetical protein [Paenibacillus larvae]MDT2242278.1 hypothetical protein [Paenibacillus larvae]
MPRSYAGSKKRAAEKNKEAGKASISLVGDARFISHNIEYVRMGAIRWKVYYGECNA